MQPEKKPEDKTLLGCTQFGPTNWIVLSCTEMTK